MNFHIINCVPVTEKLLAIARPFLRSELLDKVRVARLPSSHACRKIVRAGEGEARSVWSRTGMKGRGKREIRDKTPPASGIVRRDPARNWWKLKIHCAGMESFYECVPKDILPKEYGGNAGSFSDLHKKTIEEMIQHRDWFLEEEKLRVDESKRPDRNKSVRNAFGIVGSFKKLDID
ncbi:hypothetical protein PR048_033266 [Dryococelus australis]|uniref:Uncharacterized protein n=1 Tax=Dryococelus australis TaxID=614101 RepID=A0ABQ9FZU0_9NEOP|nr:hypothetical protein PR048_033266 [Dryococelus australis]